MKTAAERRRESRARQGNRTNHPLKSGDQKRTHQILFKVTESENKQLRNKARSKNLTLSAYIRQALGIE